MLRCLMIFIAALPSCTAQAQSDTTRTPSVTSAGPADTVYILRPDRYVGAFAKVKISVGGWWVDLPNNSYTRILCTGDSITLRIINTRLSGPSATPLVTHKRVSYFVTEPEQHAHKLDRLILAEVTQDIYSKYSLKVTREVSPHPL